MKKVRTNDQRVLEMKILSSFEIFESIKNKRFCIIPTLDSCEKNHATIHGENEKG